MMYALITLFVWWALWLFPFYRIKQPLAKWAIYIVGGLLILYGGAGTLADYSRQWYPQRSVCRDEKVYLGPGNSYLVCGELHMHDLVKVLKTKSNWSCIESPSVKGWILSDCLNTHSL